MELENNDEDYSIARNVEVENTTITPTIWKTLIGTCANIAQAHIWIIDIYVGTVIMKKRLKYRYRALGIQYRQIGIVLDMTSNI